MNPARLTIVAALAILTGLLAAWEMWVAALAVFIAGCAAFEAIVSSMFYERDLLKANATIKQALLKEQRRADRLERECAEWRQIAHMKERVP